VVKACADIPRHWVKIGGVGRVRTGNLAGDRGIDRQGKARGSMTRTVCQTTTQRRGAARLSRVLLCTLVVAIAAIALSACGGSSKPSYCSSVSNLKKSVKDLTNVNVLQNSVSSLTSALTTIESNAKSAVADAKGDFPSQTTAVTNSVNALANSVKQISGTPTPSSIRKIGQEVAAVVNSVETFASATSSKCS
jgi:hypothetical protein